MTKNGILCRVGQRRILLDPKTADPSGINFVSHAHSDHLPSRNGGAILASAETSQIAGLRGFVMKNNVDSLEGFSMFDSGHVLGSRGVLFDGALYTGDICTQTRAFLRGARVPKCKTLITECTFGLPEFDFPGVDETKKHVNLLISELYGRGVPVILMGYQLGKAQTITHLFGHWDPLYLHDSVREMNLLHKEFGIPLKDAIGHTEAQRRGLLEKKPCTECTFGLPEFDFPGIDETKKHVNLLISELYGRGVPVILMGYQLGKAQTITHLFGHWDPLYLHDSVREMNLLHKEFGIPLKDAIGHTEAQRRGLLEKKPWVMVAPLMSEKNGFIQDMKARYGAVTIGFSGWAKSARFPFGRRTDYSIPMSDHCDFADLVRMVIQSGAEKVYTIHGFVDEFAAHLRTLGIDARPLRAGTLDDFTL